MRFCSNLCFAELLFASAFGAKRVGTVSESTEKWDGNSAHVLAPAKATHQPTDRSERLGCGRKRDEIRRGNGTRRLRTAPLAVTRRRKKPPTDRGSRRKAEDKIASGSGGAPHDVTFWEGG